MKDTKLRLWPGIVAAVLIVIGFVTGILLNLTLPDTATFGILGAIIGALAVFVWWLFFSRARWSERLGAIAVMIAAWFAMRPFLDKSIAGGAMGALPAVAFPVLALGLVVWAVVTRNLSGGIRACIDGCGHFDRVSASARSSRLRASAEAPSSFIGDGHQLPKTFCSLKGNDDLAADSSGADNGDSQGTTCAKSEDGYRRCSTTPSSAGKTCGLARFSRPQSRRHRSQRADRNGLVEGSTRGTVAPADWAGLVLLRGRRTTCLYTQEQRGNDEIVASYRLSTGKPVWRHQDAVRFYESNGGAGPRGTPTILNGRVYAFGATGILNALDAATGAVLWSRNVSADSDVKVPMWGFSSSPLVINDIVVVAAEANTCGIRHRDRQAAVDRSAWWLQLQLAASDSDRWSSANRAAEWQGCDRAFAPADGAVLWRSMNGRAAPSCNRP